MSTPVLQDSAALSDGDLAKSPEPGEWRRQLIGLIAGVVLGAIGGLVTLAGNVSRDFA